jgi:hypothetical protein
MLVLALRTFAESSRLHKACTFHQWFASYNTQLILLYPTLPLITKA